MNPPGADTKNSILVVLFLLILNVVLLSTARLYPFLDMPNHLALATIYKYYDAPTNNFSNYYALDLFPKPNVFHMLFCGSPLFPSVEYTNRVFYCLYAVLYTLSVYLVIRKAGGNPWYVLLALLLLYNCNVTYGFTGFTIAIPFVLLVVYCMLCDTKRVTALNSFILAFLFLLLFFMHALATLFSVFMFFTYVVFRYRHSAKAAALKLLCALPVLLLIIAWWIRDCGEFQGGGLGASLYAYYTKTYVREIYLRLGFLVHDNFRLYGGITGYAAALFFSLFIIGVCLYPVLVKNRYQRTQPIRHASHPFIIFPCCAGLCVLVLPDAVPGFSFLFQRFSVLLLLGVVFIGSMLAGRVLSPGLKAAMLAVCCAHFALWSYCMMDFNRQNLMFDKDFLPGGSECGSMGGLMYDFRFREVSMYDNFPDYYIVWNKGIATTRTIDERSFPVRRKVGKDVLPEYLEWVGKYNNYDGRYAHMDCIVLRGDIPASAQKHFRGFYPAKSSGPWVLLRKKH